jgi:transposase
MEHHSEAFVALDTAKLRNAVAIADAGRDGEIRYLGEFDNTEVATRKLVAKLASKHTRLRFCYEAGPTGYGLYRLIKSLGHACMVVAPSLIPSKPGDHVKTNRRDAVNLLVGLEAVGAAFECERIVDEDERRDSRQQSRAVEIDLVHGFNTKSPSAERDTQGRSLPLGNCD